MIPPVLPDIIFVILFALLVSLQSRRIRSVLIRLLKKPLEKFLNGDFKLLLKEHEEINHPVTYSYNYSHPHITLQRPYLVYEGRSLNFTTEDYTYALNKRNIFFTKLSLHNQHKFLERVHHFIHNKRFVIHDEKGYKEMPILIAGTAVQLSFGLKEYLLPCFNEIHIYPDAFIGLSPLRLLIGNVSGNTINISWKHFLQGVELHDDNSNVGLHEMAHALYYQNMVDKLHVDEDFARAFPQTNKVFDVVLALEKNMGGMYSDYASKNFQEFWAESIEIFFENPRKLKTLYPHLFDAICDILNLNPLNQSNPVIFN